MTYEAYAAGESLRKQMEAIFNPEWQRDLVKRVEPQIGLILQNANVIGRIEEALTVQRGLEKQYAFFERVVENNRATVGQIQAFARLESQVRQIARSLPLPDVRAMIPSAYSDVSIAVLEQSGIFESVGALLGKATGISQPGGLTRILGPQTSAVAGLSGYTSTDKQGFTHIREDVALYFVQEATTTLLQEPERVMPASSSDLDEEALEELETFLLPTQASRAAYQAATREIAVQPVDHLDPIGARGAVLFSIFVLVWAALLGGPSEKPLTINDVGTAAGTSFAITEGVSIAELHLRGRRKAQREAIAGMSRTSPGSVQPAVHHGDRKQDPDSR